MAFEEACLQLVESYKSRSEKEREIAQRDMTDEAERKASEREMFEANQHVTRAADEVCAALHQAFDSGEVPIIPAKFAALNNPEIAPYIHQVCEVVQRLQKLAERRQALQAGPEPGEPEQGEPAAEA